MAFSLAKTPTYGQGLGDVLVSDIEQMLKLALDADLISGIVIGVLKKNETFIYALGKNIHSDSCFEIGSITKIYTVELLNVLVDRGIMNWDSPVTDYIPMQLRGDRCSSDNKECFTLLDLASHRSGLPLLPSNLRILDGWHPFADYSTDDLERYICGSSFKKPTHVNFSYSNLGFALLGYAMEKATGKTYHNLLHEELLCPLNLLNTDLASEEVDLPALAQGHTQSGRPTSRWTQKAFAPAGALCSTVADQLIWLKTLLQTPHRRAFGYDGGTLDTNRTLGWANHSLGDIYCRDGVTGGFCSYLSINPRAQSGLVLLTNRKCLLLMQAIAYNCECALLRLPILQLKGDYGMMRARILDSIRNGRRSSYALGLIRGRKEGAFLLDKLRRCLE